VRHNSQALGSFWARLYHLFGIPSEGDKRDSKHGLASRDFAPEPATRTRPRGIFGAVLKGSPEHSGRNAASDCGGLGWSRLPRSAQTLFNACTTSPRVEGNTDNTREATGSMPMGTPDLQTCFASHPREQTRFRVIRLRTVTVGIFGYLFRRELERDRLIASILSLKL